MTTTHADHAHAHAHAHGDGCGHQAVTPGDHVDDMRDVHDGHRHAAHDERWDEH